LGSGSIRSDPIRFDPLDEEPSFSFYTSRERPGVHERKRKEGKEERGKQRRRKLRAMFLFFPCRRAPLVL